MVYKNRREDFIMNQRRYRLRLRRKILNLLGNKCIHCGCSDIRCLQIDHVNNNGYEERQEFQCGTARYHVHVIEQILAGSQDYQLLCANCNQIKKYEHVKKEIIAPKRYRKAKWEEFD